MHELHRHELGESGVSGEAHLPTLVDREAELGVKPEGWCTGVFDVLEHVLAILGQCQQMTQQRGRDTATLIGRLGGDDPDLAAPGPRLVGGALRLRSGK